MAQSVNVTGLQELKKSFRSFSVINLTSKLERALNKGALIIERLAKVKITTNRSVATGFLRASITHRVVRKAEEIYAEVGTNVEYAKDVEYGTSPHKVPDADLKKWFKRKGIPKRYWLRISLSIQERGTKPHPFLTPAYRDSVAEIMEMIKEASTRAVKDGNK